MKQEEWLVRAETRDALGQSELERVAGAAVEALLRAAPGAGLTIRDLNALLDSGMSMDELFDYVASLLLRKTA